MGRAMLRAQDFARPGIVRACMGLSSSAHVPPVGRQHRPHIGCSSSIASLWRGECKLRSAGAGPALPQADSSKCPVLAPHDPDTRQHTHPHLPSPTHIFASAKKQKVNNSSRRRRRLPVLRGRAEAATGRGQAAQGHLLIGQAAEGVRGRSEVRLLLHVTASMRGPRLACVVSGSCPPQQAPAPDDMSDTGTWHSVDCGTQGVEALPEDAQCVRLLSGKAGVPQVLAGDLAAAERLP
jgi:hypothetical protein